MGRSGKGNINFFFFIVQGRRSIFRIGGGGGAKSKELEFSKFSAAPHAAKSQYKIFKLKIMYVK